MRVTLSLVLALSLSLGLAGCHRRARVPRYAGAAVASAGVPTPMDALRSAATGALGCDSAAFAPLESGIVEAAGCGRVREMLAADDAGTVWLAIPSVRTIAARDLSCAAADLRLTAPASRRRIVHGCGAIARYELVCGAQCAWASADDTTSAAVATATDDAPFVAAPAPVATAPALDPSATVRTRLTEAHAALRRCAWGRYDVHATWTAEGAITYALGGPLAGTSAETCVREAMGDARVYASAAGGITVAVE